MVMWNITFEYNKADKWAKLKKIIVILHVEPSEFYGVIKPVTTGADSDLLAIDLTDMK